MAKISCIVPVFNAEKYLEKCAASVLCQSFLDFELILVDDGSSDKSREICSALSKKDGRVKFFQKQNGGVSSARNVGMEKALGEWIMFLDADDELSQGAFEFVAKKADCRAEAIFFGANIRRAFGKEESFPCCKNEAFFSKNEFLAFYAKGRAKDENFMLFNSVCAKAISKKIASKIRFDEKIKIGEDQLFNLEIFSCASSFLLSPKCFYNYIKREGSATTRRQNFSDFKDILKCALSAKNFYERHGLLRHKRHLKNYLHKTLYNFCMIFFKNGNSLFELKKLSRKEKKLFALSVIFSGPFHPKEILFLLKCKIIMETPRL